MEALIIGIALFTCLMVFIQWIRLRKLYQNSLVKSLYSGYLEWFIRYYFKKNLSQSNPLEATSKYARILYHRQTDQKKQQVVDFVVVALPQGLSLLVLLSGVTFVSGSKTGEHWQVMTTQGKKGKISNYYRIGLKHKAYLEQKIAHPWPIQVAVVVGNVCDISQMKSDVLMIKADQILDFVMKDGQAHYSDGALMDMIEQLEKENKDV